VAEPLRRREGAVMRLTLRYEIGVAITDAIRPGRTGEVDIHVAATVRPGTARMETEGGRSIGYLVFDVADPTGWLMDALARFEPPRPQEPALAPVTALPSPGRTGRTATGCGLTRRESEVLLLVADGMSNRAIAKRLFLSPRTVEKHVERLLTKTGTSNRVQLVSYRLRAAAS
jgi:DNA-binding CsgD family transcriptional regulator